MESLDELTKFYLSSSDSSSSSRALPRPTKLAIMGPPSPCDDDDLLHLLATDPDAVKRKIKEANDRTAAMAPLIESYRAVIADSERLLEDPLAR